MYIKDEKSPIVPGGPEEGPRDPLADIPSPPGKREDRPIVMGGEKAEPSGALFRSDLFELFIQFFFSPGAGGLKDFISQTEREVILNILAKTQGNQKEASKVLGLKYTTLNQKLKKYKIRIKKIPQD